MAAEPRDAKKIGILIVEDDRIASSDLKVTLERQGFDVTGIAESGEEAVKRSTERKPDLALVDIRLRGAIDGIAAAENLSNSGVPVVFLTGYSSDEVFKRARRVRPAGYLRKPFSDGELAACLDAAIGPARRHRSDAPLPPPVTPTAADRGEKISENLESEDPAIRVPALAKARELSRRESFRELLGFRQTGEDAAETDLEDPETETPELPERKPASLIEEIADPILALDESWRVIYANAEALAYFGGTTALIGREFWEGLAPETKEEFEPEFLRPLEGDRRHTFEFHDSIRDRWLEVNAYPSGKGILALFRDVSGRRQAEAERERVRQLEGLGFLARGFAHDFNNLLTVLIGNLDFARERYPGDAEFQSEMGNAESAANQAKNLVLQLLTFAQGGRPIREPVRISDLLRQILDERRKHHTAIRYQFQCVDPNLEVSIDAAQIRRLILNLIVNAEQAMAGTGGGTLIGRCGFASGDEVGRWNGRPFPSEEEHLVIEIIDTGRGMSEADLAQAFDPYFSTRTDANATGIGLTVCESIAKAHEGFVLLQSKLGRGTIATFCMPLGPPSWIVEGEADRDTSSKIARKGHPPTGAPQRGLAASARILVLEDDLQIRKLISMTLRKDGHDVVETADGRDTINQFEAAKAAGKPFDLVVSDLTIENGLGGVKTMQALRRIDPGVVAIVSSGYSDAPAMARPEEFGFSAVLPKPYPPRELRRIVSEVLAGSGKVGDRREG